MASVPDVGGRARVAGAAARAARRVRSRAPHARGGAAAGLLVVLALILSVAPAHAQAPLPAAPDTAASGTLRGSVVGSFQNGRTSLAHATIEATRGARRWVTSSDEDGRYVLSGLPAGDLTVRASYPGHGPLELLVALPAHGTVEIDLELLAEPIALSPLRVERQGGDVRVPTPGEASVEHGAPHPEIEMQTLDLSPGVAQSGLIDAIGGLGGNDPADPTDVLFMRGSTSDLKLVLLDGVPVYTPFHVAGLLRSFEPAVLGRADLHVGGAPARYDGGLTHILDLRTRAARRDRPRASGAVDLMTASAAVEAPLGSRAGIIASGRALHDLGETPLQARRPYGYRDGLVAVDAEPADGHVVRATGFWNSEEVLLGYQDGPEEASWGNRAGSATYERSWNDVRVQTTVGGSAYAARLPLQPASSPRDRAPAPLLATAETERLRMVAEAVWGRSETWRAGVSYERMDAAYKAETLAGEGATNESRARAETVGGYVEAMRPIAPGLTIRAGLRADHFSGTGARLAPRAALLWEVAPDALLTVAAGRYHQPTRAPGAEVEHTLAEMAETGLTAAELLPVATADHVVLSLRQRLAGSVSLDLGGFWKRYEGLRADPTETVLSSGLDLRVMSGRERASVWLGYGLSWFWSGIDLSGRTNDFAGRHLLTTGLAGRLAGPIRGEARVSYGAGLPYTSIPFTRAQSLDAAGPGLEATSSGGRVTSASGVPLVEGLDESFLRVDLEVHARFEPEWGGRPWVVRPYLRVLNALDRRDALFYSFQPWRGDELTPLAERSLLPLFGVAFSF